MMLALQRRVERQLQKIRAPAEAFEAQIRQLNAPFEAMRRSVEASIGRCLDPNLLRHVNEWAAFERLVEELADAPDQPWPPDPVPAAKPEAGGHRGRPLAPATTSPSSSRPRGRPSLKEAIRRAARELSESGIIGRNTSKAEKARLIRTHLTGNPRPSRGLSDETIRQLLAPEK